MRRKDREVQDITVVLQIIERSDTIRIGMVEDGTAYMVPLSFGYAYKDEMLHFYFHSANEGRKVRLLAENPNVTFEMDTAHCFLEKEEGCGCTMDFASVMGQGVVTCLTDEEEKKAGLRHLLSHYTGNRKEFQDAVAAGTNVYRLDVEKASLSCKLHRDKDIK